MSTTNTLPTSLVWLLAQCMVSLGTLHRHSFFFLFAQCVVLMSLGGPQKATLNSCTEHRTSSTQASTCTVHWQLLVQACLSWSAFVRCLVTCPLRLSSCVLQVDIFDTHTHTHTYIYIYMGHAVVQLVEALRYKPGGRGFDSRWCHWNFSLT